MHWYTDVLKKYTLFTGRAARQEYWMFVLISFIISAALGIVDGAFDTRILGNIYMLAVLLPSIAVAMRRLHDIGKSGWWLLLALIPIIGWIVLIVFLATDSESGTNQYGPNPKGVNALASTSTPVVSVAEKVPEAPMQDEVLINDIPVAEPAVDPEEKI